MFLFNTPVSNLKKKSTNITSEDWLLCDFMHSPICFPVFPFCSVEFGGFDQKRTLVPLHKELHSRLGSRKTLNST